MTAPDSPDLTPEAPEEDTGARVLVWLTIVATIAGAITGLVGGAFRWLLIRADHLRADLIDWTHHHGPAAWLIPVVISATAALIAALITRWEPRAAGSGIQHVEAVERGEAAPPPPAVIPARFVGGLLAIGVGGMVLGREGPTVHMGAAIGALTGRVCRATMREIRVLQTTLSGAGLAVAFNAPISGTLFCIEEIAKTVKVRYVLWTMAAVAAGTVCSRLIVGNHPDFVVPQINSVALSSLPVFVVFGVVVGLLGVVYNWLIRACLSGFAAIPRVPGPVKAAIIGAVIGAVLTIDPDLGGGGDDLTQNILSGQHLAFWAIVMLLAIRFVAGPVSYSAGTPGGIFAPMLALGAMTGLVASRLIDLVSPGYGHELLLPLMIVGMSSFFTAVVRAPFTGAVLVMEMTSTTSVAVSVLAAGAATMIVAELLRSPPIYDDLRERMLRQWKGHEAEGV
ncbi:ClC family H(+)/Cl(-) exchange transporter [Gordonia polyisoprenivorans]|uniref:ClC family H(+)/Cl(-) exchange transporter n=1 Tax=Gordonia polyisoprenivorans TaxID=84595 RepID=UPI001AD6AD85|nr:ClC family H(+)/Cl(-) exchange transporter [Gordonia polyisoprenivorans]QTI68230.1 ClC family H(+)/Cl(-) exchange transporter [Gordonia polyisoprenivorans]